MTDIAAQMDALGRAARASAMVLAHMPSAQKTQALHAAAAALRTHANAILSANRTDMDAATHLDAAMRDRLLLTEKRIAAMADGVDAVADLPDPVGHILSSWDNPANGLHFEKVAVPLGVIGIIYESRPNVTADAAAIALKAGNAVILRGGSESFHSSRAIVDALHAGLAQAGVPTAAVQLVPTTDRAAVRALLEMHQHIDVIIPRGGKSLVERVRAEARVPTLLHLDGNCHVYLHAAADPATAQAVVMNAKLRRTGVCGAAESLLIDQAAPGSMVKDILTALLDAGCELRGDDAVCALDPRIARATDEDWSTEFLAPILSVKMVAGIDDAIAHINRYGSHHTDAIVTADEAAARAFTHGVDSAIVMVNASTQFADGGEFGFGGEIGIATGRLHARGPVGAPELTTYKYVVTTGKPGGAVRAG